jgi:hypothetical protein
MNDGKHVGLTEKPVERVGLTIWKLGSRQEDNMKVSRKWYAKCKVIQYPLPGWMAVFYALKCPVHPPPPDQVPKFRRGFLETPSHLFTPYRLKLVKQEMLRFNYFRHGALFQIKENYMFITNGLRLFAFIYV